MNLLNKKEIINEVITFFEGKDISLKDIIIIMGAALVLHNIRHEAFDIDVSCSEEAFEKLLLLGYSLQESRSGFRKICDGNISIYENWPVDGVENVQGLSVANIISIVNDKCQFGRKKDFDDIALIIPKRSSNVEFFEVFSYPHYLRGLLHFGDTDEVYVIINGYFSSNKIGVNSMYYSIASSIGEIGKSVLRIDLSGMGESEGDFDKLSFNRHIADLFVVVKELIKRGYKRIGLIGHCEGCYPAIKMLEYFQEIVSLTLISPVFATEKAMDAFFGREKYSELCKNGQVYRKGLLCKKDFFDLDYLFYEDKYLNRIRQVKSLVLLSENDEFADNEKVIEWATRYSIKVEVIYGADHNFLTREMKNQLVNNICANILGETGEY